MITGIVTNQRQALIDVTIAGPAEKSITLPVVIDTGFNGYISLKQSMIEELGLPPFGELDVTLADGSEARLMSYSALVHWGHEKLNAIVYAVKEDALLGMSLLRGYQLVMDVIENGAVTLTPLNA